MSSDADTRVMTESSRTPPMYLDWNSTALEPPGAEPPQIADVPPLRLVRPKDGPTLSVILATRKSLSELSDRLPSLVVACSQLAAELIVIATDNGGPNTRPLSRHVRFLSAPADASVSQLRALAMTQVTGDIVVLLDDDAASSRTWTERLRSWSRRAEASGVDEPARSARSNADWQTYFNRAVVQSS